MQWREDLEAFALELRAQARDWGLIPLNEYKDGAIEFKWDGKLHAVSKTLYSMVHRTKMGKDNERWEHLKAAFVAHGHWAARAKK